MRPILTGAQTGKNDVTTGKSAQFSMFLGEIFEKSPVTGDFLRNKVLKIFCERDILRKLLCSKGLVTRDANTWSNFYSSGEGIDIEDSAASIRRSAFSAGRQLHTHPQRSRRASVGDATQSRNF